jgi:hypothetical protein
LIGKENKIKISGDYEKIKIMHYALHVLDENGLSIFPIPTPSRRRVIPVIPQHFLWEGRKTVLSLRSFCVHNGRR